MEKTTMILCAALALLNSNCDDGQQVRPIDSLGARLVAYDEDGTERTTFEANTNIAFILSFNNNSDHAIEAGSYFEFCDVYEKADFLLIYKWVREDNGQEKWRPYGKPYQSIYCPTAGAMVIVPAFGETKVHGGIWNNVRNNPPLTAGKYYTAFSFNLELDGESRQHDLKLEFEVH
jgi:hypothetical protein